MKGEWVSQSRARELFGLSASDLQANISHVIDESCTNKDDTSQSNVADIKCVRYPRVPLTVRLVKNPRGYRLPMRLYKTSELQALSQHKRVETAPRKLPDKTTKKTRKKRIEKCLPQVQQECITKGHTFVKGLENMHQCTVCGQTVEIEII
ncbi:uncharacterized protein BBOV_IV001665 [Babesia bovis T2Bo]|uniref:uncharacterized protein n=1 Tax=Babesia bovis T2Bo TaxID=484906 RepID=UPI001DE70DF8|nr:uncharacterized protein BBOV_IV001665 [Babesia bovis T2Bo]KAG6439898.1 hypothetical protein BBOV_IV001665 [Babesia bovis T2Bo]